MKEKDKAENTPGLPPVTLDEIVLPRVNFCWHCGKKLRGRHFVEIIVFNLHRICHKQCAEDIKKNGAESQTYDNAEWTETDERLRKQIVADFW